jgi:hypothetical protein
MGDTNIAKESVTTIFRTPSQTRGVEYVDNIFVQNFSTHTQTTTINLKISSQGMYFGPLLQTLRRTLHMLCYCIPAAFPVTIKCGEPQIAF